MFEGLINLFSPHACVACHKEKTLLCEGCHRKVWPKISSCFMCNTLTKNGRTCERCRRKTHLKRVVTASYYENPIKQLIFSLKYERARKAAKVLGRVLSRKVQESTSSTYSYVSHVPSATSRFRRRGYNPAELITKEVAQNLKLPHFPTLHRLGQSDQIGSNRKERTNQLKGKFYAPRNYLVKDAKILLIDDVVTTGATLRECSSVLKDAGAKSVEAAVVAKRS